MFNIHESLIRSRPSYLETALAGDRWFGKCISLPDESSDIVELYLQYLYTSKLFINWTTDLPDIPDGECLPEYYTLAELYTFGERMRDVDFKNAISDAFRKRMSKPLDDYSHFCVCNYSFDHLP